LFVQSLGANSIQYQPLLPNNLKMHERKRSRYWISDSNLPLLDGVVDRLIGLKEDNPAFVKNSAMNLSLFKKYFRGALTSEQIECTSAHSTVLVSNQGTLTTCFSCYGDVKTNNLKEALDGDERMRAWEKARRCSWPCLLPCFCDQ